MVLRCKNQVFQRPYLYSYIKMKLTRYALIFLVSMFGFIKNGSTLEFTPKAFRLDFNQEFMSITGKVKSSKGSLEYLFPSNIRIKEYKDNSEFVSNEKNSWYYVPPFVKGEKGTVQINQAGSMVLGKLFDSLRPGLKDTEFFKSKVLNEVATLDFTAKGKQDWKVEAAKLFFKEKTLNPVMKELNKIEITYTDKKKVTLTFFNYMSDVKYPPDYFVFQVPKNTQVIR